MAIGAWLLASASACSSSGGGETRDNGANAGNGGQETTGSGGSSAASNGGGIASAGASGSVAAGAGNNASGGSSGTSGASNGPPPGPFAIASASRSTCALDGQGLIHCWGEAPGVWSIPDGPFIEIHASIDAFCAVRADHSFTCFDAPVVGAAPSGVQDTLPTGKVEAMTMDRGCICWTDDTGHSACNSPFREQSMVPAGTTFSQFEVGFDHACGISASDRTVQCWGFPGDATCAVQDAGRRTARCAVGGFRVDQRIGLLGLRARQERRAHVLGSG